MLEFREIELGDRERINSALKASDRRGCEYSFANNMAWRRLAGSRIAFYKDFYICCAFETEDGVPQYILPAGSGDIREVIGEMSRYSASLGKPLVVRGVTEEMLTVLDELFPGGFTAQADRGNADYIYASADLIALPGRKYHAKRNHLARFMEQEHEFSLITEKDFDDCLTFAVETYNSRNSTDQHSFVAEQFAINTFFTYFNELGLTGGVIRSGGRVRAVTIGERLNSDTFCVHIEKADTSVSGIYAGINNLFASAAAADMKYINREEDMDIEGLRKAKLSYHPAFLLNKYTVTFR